MPQLRLALAAALLTMTVALAATPQSVPYQQSIARWRAEHQAALAAEDGWLTVVGLEWLKPGVNRAGSAAGSDIKLPKGTPPAIGVFRLDGGSIRFEPASGAQVALNGKPASAQVLRPDVDRLTAGSLTLFVIKRGDRFGIRIKDSNSAARKRFAGESWYPVRQAWRVVARFESYSPPHMIAIVNILGQEDRQPSPGVAVFTIGGKEYRLEPITEGDQLFFIFKDATSNSGTYPAGRFLYAPLPHDGRVVLDFNKAENPPCAFTPFATCPLPPKQNQLPIRVEAGERYQGRH